MCGIAGHVDFAGARSGETNAALAQAMGDAIRHRGPDSGATLQATPETWLSFRRLAIVDTSEAGNQPMSTPDGCAHIVFNGEAYNAGDLRSELEAAGFAFRGHSDTEVVLYGCRHWGVAEVSRRLIGMFAFAYVDSEARTVSLICDRLGKKPLYWFEARSAFAFASSSNRSFSTRPVRASWIARRSPSLSACSTSLRRTRSMQAFKSSNPAVS